MSACFSVVAAEALRLTTPSEPGAGPLIEVDLLDADPELVRARGVPRYLVTLRINWGPDIWRAGVELVDVRGYAVAWTFQELGQWFAKCLSGAPCAVMVNILDASSLPIPWTPSRAQTVAGRVAALDAQSLIGQAHEKALSVSAWVDSGRRAAVLGSAARMIEAAALLDDVKAVQTGAAFGAEQMQT